MKEKACCFTGHRNIPKKDVDRILDRVDALVRALVNKGVTCFYVGGALGFDTMVAQSLFLLRDIEHLNINVILVCPFDGFISRWHEDQQQRFETMLPRYDKVIYKEETGSREAYLSRNRHLVDNSSYCIAYCTRNYGGTAYTVRYAMKNGVTVLNTADNDIDVF